MLFKEIVGHTKLKNRLINTVLNHRVSHAQLFLGAEGSEKLALAVAYAQYIACNDKQSFNETDGLIGDSCGKCPSCIKYKKLAHPDLHFIFPVASTKEVKTKPQSDHFIEPWREALLDSNFYLNHNEWYKKIGIENKQGRIGVDDANSIIKTLSIRAYEGKYKVMIIWMIEKLYHAAAPKLLKILEEPPEKTLFLLITEDANSILKTILSRTQLIKVPPLEDKCISRYLQMNFNVSNEKLDTYVNIADGNFKNLLPILANNEEDNPHFSPFRQMMLLAYSMDVAKMRTTADDISKIGRENIKQLLAFGLRIVRLCMYHSIGSHELIKSNGSELEFVKKFSRFVHKDNADQITTLLNEAIFHIERNVNPKITIMDTLLKIGGILHQNKI